MAMKILVHTLNGDIMPMEVYKQTTLGEIRTKLVFWARAGDYTRDWDGSLICFETTWNFEQKILKCDPPAGCDPPPPAGCDPPAGADEHLDEGLEHLDEAQVPEPPWKMRRLGLEVPFQPLTAENLLDLVGEDEMGDCLLLEALDYAEVFGNHGDSWDSNPMYQGPLESCSDDASSGGSTWRYIKRCTRYVDARDARAASDDSDAWEAASASDAASSVGQYFLASAMGTVRESFWLKCHGRCRGNWQTVADVNLEENDFLYMVPRS